MESSAAFPFDTPRAPPRSFPRLRERLNWNIAKQALAAAFAAQAGRAFVWGVVGFAVGIAIFFAWPTDPLPGLGPLVALAGVLLLIFGKRLRIGAFAAYVLLTLGAGHAFAALRTALVATPVLTRPLPAAEIRGRVADAEARPASYRVTLEALRVPGLAPEQTPVRVRLTIPLKQGLPKVGDHIAVKAILRPPMRPILPDGFQFQRFLYFESIGGAGFAIGPWQVEEGAPDHWRDSLMAKVEALRRYVAARVMAAIADRGDATTTAALIMGDQGAIPGDLQEAYRVSGLAHLLSISGVHMSLLAAAVFFLVRRGLALVPVLALRVDTKKIAAWTALGATALYLLISGLSVPAVRSFLMIGVVLAAILLDRTALSLRSIAWAALILMAIYPDAVIGASFQMSFMAVLALIAFAEHVSLHVQWRDRDGTLNIPRAAGLIFAGLVITDIIAGGATALFAIYHFNRFPTYSMASNLVAGPITGLWVMPWGLVAMLMMPFGLDAIPLQLMGAGVGLVNAVARTVAQWPGAQVHVPPMSSLALAVGAGGMTFLCLWQGRARWLGLLLIGGALTQPWLTRAPDILFDETAKVVAVTDDHGHLMMRPMKGENFTREVWEERYGRSETAWPKAGERTLGLRCDSDGCILNRQGRRVLIAFTDAALAEDCRRVDAAVSVPWAYSFCRGIHTADGLDLRRYGAVALWLSPNGVRTRFVTDGMGDRPWSRHEAPRAQKIKKSEIRDRPSSDDGDAASNSDAAIPPDVPEP